jgi:hypothetical protein
MAVSDKNIDRLLDRITSTGLMQQPSNASEKRP